MVRRMRAVNEFSTTLNGAINNSGTSVVVADATGLPTEGDVFLDIAGEIVLMTGRTGNTLTVERGQEGTSAVSHADNSSVTDVITKGYFEKAANERMGLQALPYGRCTSWDGSTLTTLTAADFNLINTASGTAVSDGNDGTIVFQSRDHSSNDATGATRTFGSGGGDVRVIAHIDCPGFDYASPDILHFNTRQTTGGSMRGLEFTPRTDISATSRVTFLGAPTKHVSHGVGGRNDIWFMFTLEFNYSASNERLIGFYSKDGVNWWELYTWTFAASGFQIGIWLTNVTGSIANMRAHILRWHEEPL